MSNLKFKFSMPDDETLARYISIKGEKGEKGDPTKLSQLENDEGFVKSDTNSLANYYAKTETDNRINAAVAALDGELGVPDGFFTDESETVSGEGQTITFNGTANAILKDIKLYGDTRQDGTPTPDNPVDVQVVTGDQTIIISDNDQQSQSFALSLGEIELVKIGSYQDSIWYDDGVWKIRKAIAKGQIYVNTIVDSYSNLIYATVVKPADYIGKGNYDDYSVLSEVATYQYKTGNTWDVADYIYKILPNANTNLFYMGLPLSTTLEEAREIINGSIIYYPLANTVEEEIDDSELIKQLNALLAAKSYKGTTQITANGNIPAFLFVNSFKANWSGTICGLNKGINDKVGRAEFDEKPYCFDSVAEMQTYDLKAGDRVKTLGYHSTNDGGGAYYVITDSEPNSYYETLENGLYAILVHTGNIVRPSQFGAYHDGIHDDHDALQSALDALHNNDAKVLDLQGFTYWIASPLILESNYRCVIKNGEVKALNSFTIDSEDTENNFLLITSNINTNPNGETFGTFPTEDLTIDRVNFDAQLISGLGCLILNRFIRVNITNCQFKRYTTKGLYLPSKNSHEVNVNNSNFLAFLGSEEEALHNPGIGIYNDTLDGMFDHLIIIGGQYGIYNNKGANIYSAIHIYGQLEYSLYHAGGTGVTYTQMYIDGKGVYWFRPWLSTFSDSFFLVESTPLTLDRGDSANIDIKGLKVSNCVANNYTTGSTFDVITLPNGNFRTIEECEFDITNTNMTDNRYLVNVNKITKPQVVFLDGTQQEISISSVGTITGISGNSNFTKSVVNNVINVTGYTTTGWSWLGIVLNLDSDKTYKIINKYTNGQKNFRIYSFSSIEVSQNGTVLKPENSNKVGYEIFNSGSGTVVLAVIDKGVFDIEISEA